MADRIKLFDLIFFIKAVVIKHDEPGGAVNSKLKIPNAFFTVLPLALAGRKAVAIRRTDLLLFAGIKDLFWEYTHYFVLKIVGNRH